MSTTHTITGAIIGVCAARRTSAVRQGIAGNIVVAGDYDSNHRRDRRLLLFRCRVHCIAGVKQVPT